MAHVQEGQCGLCKFFGQEHPDDQQLVQIHQQQEGPEDFVDECGHPQHVGLHLRVTPISGCDGFQPVPELQEARR